MGSVSLPFSSIQLERFNSGAFWPRIPYRGEAHAAFIPVKVSTTKKQFKTDSQNTKARKKTALTDTSGINLY